MWFEWLILGLGAYLAVVLIRGFVHFVSWLTEDVVAEREERQWARERLREHVRQSRDAPASGEDRSHEKRRRRHYRPSVAATVLRTVSPAHWLAELAELGRWFVSRKHYDYWVGRAMGVEDPRLKVKYLTQALRLDPHYSPAWGLQGHAWLKLERYQEALECFDRVLEIHPNATSWYKKGLCCQRLKRPQDALHCFDQALANCPQTDRTLLEDVRREKRRVEQDLEHCDGSGPEGSTAGGHAR